MTLVATPAFPLPRGRTWLPQPRDHIKGVTIRILDGTGRGMAAEHHIGLGRVGVRHTAAIAIAGIGDDAVARGEDKPFKVLAPVVVGDDHATQTPGSEVVVPVYPPHIAAAPDLAQTGGINESHPASGGWRTGRTGGQQRREQPAQPGVALPQARAPSSLRDIRDLHDHGLGPERARGVICAHEGQERPQEVGDTDHAPHPHEGIQRTGLTGNWGTTSVAHPSSTSTMVCSRVGMTV